MRPPWAGRVFRLRTILLYVHLVILVLPITGLGVLRVYENELMRRTETELLASGAFARAHYLMCLQALAKDRGLGPAQLGRWIQDEHLRARHEGVFHHIPSTVDLNAIRPEPQASPARPAPPGWQAPAQPVAGCAEQTSALMQQAQRVTLAGMRVVDAQGVVLASSREELGMSLAHREEVRRALRGEYHHVVRRRHSDEPMPPVTSISRRSSVRLFIAMPIVWESHVLGAVILSRTPLSLARALYDNRHAFIGFGVGLFLAVLALTWYTSRAVLRPVEALIDQTRRLRRGDQAAAQPLPHPVTYEVQQLSQAVVELSVALFERADYIKTFASHVSHEFKTPLTSIRATVELFEDHLEGMSEQERARFLQIIDEDAARLQRLVDRLMELARADVLHPGQQRCDPGPVLDEAARHHQSLGLALTLRVDDALRGLQVPMNAVTLGSILTNLLENARQHGGPQVQVCLEADLLPPEQPADQERDDALSERDATLRLVLQDDGPGVSIANRDKIYAPFFTTARERGGTGIGLSVVASLLQAHQGRITLEDCPRGARFVVTLPLVHERDVASP